jgi:hypothetical protein
MMRCILPNILAGIEFIRIPRESLTRLQIKIDISMGRVSENVAEKSEIRNKLFMANWPPTNHKNYEALSSPLTGED